MGRLLLCRAPDALSSPRKAWAHIQEVEKLGGMAKAIEAGIPKLRIEEAAAQTQARIDAGHQTIVGVNHYKPDNEASIDGAEGRQRRPCARSSSTS